MLYDGDDSFMLFLGTTYNSALPILYNGGTATITNIITTANHS